MIHSSYILELWDQKFNLFDFLYHNSKYILIDEFLTNVEFLFYKDSFLILIEKVIVDKKSSIFEGSPYIEP